MSTHGRELTRDTENGMIAGVCAGLGRYFDVDATLVRALFIAATVLSGFGAALYVVLWIMVDDRQHPPPDAPRPPAPLATTAAAQGAGPTDDLIDISEPAVETGSPQVTIEPPPVVPRSPVETS